MSKLLILCFVIAAALADVSHLGYQYKVPKTSYGYPSYQLGESSTHRYSSDLSDNSGLSSGISPTLSSLSSSGISPTTAATLLSSGSSSSGLSSGLTSGLSSDFSSGLSSAFSSGLPIGVSSGLSSGLPSTSSSGYSSGLLSSSSTGLYSGFSSGIPSGYEYKGSSLGSTFGSSGFSGLGIGSGYYFGDANSAGSGLTTNYYPYYSTSGSGLGGLYYPTSSVSDSSSAYRPIYSSFGDLSQTFTPNYNEYKSIAASKYQQHYVQQQPAQVYKHYYVHTAPEEPEIPRPRPPIVLPPAQKHYKIIFVKTPSQTRTPQIIPVPQQHEEKTIVYVLSKKPEEPQDILVPKIEQKPPTKPEVFFIKYKNNEDSQAVINNIVNDYNKEQSVSFSGLGEVSPNTFGSGSQTILESGSNIGSNALPVYTVPSASPISQGQYIQSLSNAPVEIPSRFSSIGTPTISINKVSGPESFSVLPSFGASDSSILGSTPVSTISTVTSIPESSTASVISSGLVSSTPSTLLFDDITGISTSQGVPHETYGPPKFRAN